VRTALLAAIKRTPTGELRASLKLSGRTVLAWQTDIARRLGCERIICLCESATPEILSLQQDIEASGGEFHAVRSSLQLVSLLRADEDLVVLLDGMVPDKVLVQSIACDGETLRRGVWTIPANHELAQAHPNDFERIDAERCWAGLISMRASQAQKLADWPPDGDAVSLLLRIALQARVEARALPFDTMQIGVWLLADSMGALESRQAALIAQSAAIPPWTGPSRAISTLLTRSLAPLWLSNGPVMSAAAGLALGTCAMLLAVLGYDLAGMICATLGAFSASLASVWARLSAALLDQGLRAKRWQHFNAIIGILAAVVLLIIVLNSNPESWAFVPAMMAIFLIWERPPAGPPTINAFWIDHALHLTCLTVCAAYGVLGTGIVVLAVLALLQMAAFQRAG
jgi:hypothetical protein